MPAEVDDAAAAGSDALTDCTALYFLFCQFFMAFEPKVLFLLYTSAGVDLRKVA